MKHNTSIILSEALVKEIDAVIDTQDDLSVFVEEAVREYLQRRKVSTHNRNQSDLELINLASDDLNKEAGDVLLYQVDY